MGIVYAESRIVREVVEGHRTDFLDIVWKAQL
jgi:hypothetical protein